MTRRQALSPQEQRAAQRVDRLMEFGGTFVAFAMLLLALWWFLVVGEPPPR